MQDAGTRHQQLGPPMARQLQPPATTSSPRRDETLARRRWAVRNGFAQMMQLGVVK